jgi:protein-S-isoprenylcysteine O-methyltransferase Ste14
MNWSRVARRIRVPLGFAFAVIYVWLARPTWHSIAFGAIVAAIGVTIRALASGYVRKNDELTTTGPYAYSRNPLYVGSMVIGAGFAIASRSWWVVLGLVVLLVAIYVPVIRSEEAFLRGRFPEFDSYCRRVPRFIGWTPNIGNVPGAFSRELYLQHREYNAILGSLATVCALVVKIIWFMPH